MSTTKQKLAVALLIVLAVTLSFGLGYLTAKSGKRAPIIIEKYSEK